MKYTIIILLSTTEKWLRLARNDRQKFSEQVFEPLVHKYHETLKVRLFDSESFNAKNTDFMIIETSNLNDFFLGRNS